MNCDDNDFLSMKLYRPLTVVMMSESLAKQTDVSFVYTSKFVKWMLSYVKMGYNSLGEALFLGICRINILCECVYDACVCGCRVSFSATTSSMILFLV